MGKMGRSEVHTHKILEFFTYRLITPLVLVRVCHTTALVLTLEE
jgi:hypothetical protein